jgi:multidrug transporter EmrE-like cation transporter
MAKPLFILVGTQCLFTLSDVMGRTYMVRYGFKLSTFISLWFLVYTLVRQLATLGQVYIFANIQLGKTMAMFGAVSIVLSNVIGLLYFGERISSVSYFGISLAVLAFIVMGFK